MIGVIANPADHAVVLEFFELFKTPWEFYRSGRFYDVLLFDGTGEVDEQNAKIVLIYAGQSLRQEAVDNTLAATSGDRSLLYKGMRVPIYGSCLTFPERESNVLVDAESQEPAAYFERSSGRVRARIGYDLFREIRFLLAKGQPASGASIPTLDLHIAFLRDLIVASGAQLVEIAPAPQGYQFIACLTHDVDHPLIRQHRFDMTMFGFLYRAIFSSLINLLKGRIPLLRLVRNWAAAVRLPFVHLGLANDFWGDFERYPTLEGHRSSFFVIPFSGDPGQGADGPAPKRRASRYGAADIDASIQSLISSGCEIGLHGIEAWRDSSRGLDELNEIRRVTGAKQIGVRMHWLYFDEQSPVILEKAGADYDSTFGYNETIGYRAGTTQVFKPLAAKRLLELPLHVMDTALFYPAHLDLSDEEAWKQVKYVIDNAVRFGGTFTVNWHDRSIMPERCWDTFYVRLIEELKIKGAWFATAGEAVAWFRRRRAVRFDTSICESELPNVDVPRGAGFTNLPPLRLEVYNARKRSEASTTLPNTLQGCVK